MKFIITFIVLVFSGTTLGGGDTNCGSLQANYLVLLQACEYLLDESLKTVNIAVDLYIGNSFLDYFICNLDLTINTMALGTSQFSGISSDYIRGIFDGLISPPFVHPLSCIEDELLSFNLFVKNLTENVVPNLETQVIPSPINETTPCPIVVQMQSQNLVNANLISSIEVNAAITASSVFASIGLSSLYIDQNNLFRQSCGSNLVIDNFAEFYNMDPAIISAFIQNQTISVPPPLNCTKSIVTSLIQGFDYNIANINNSLNNTSVPSSCEPFYSDFKAFKDIWFQYVDQLRFNTINIIIENPVLAPFFVADLLCELDIIFTFAANATSYLSGIDSDIIYSILKGDIVNPLPAPLDCIANDLTFMSNQITHLVNNVIPGFQNIASISPSNTSTCNTTYTALTGYVVQLVDLLNKKGFFVTSATALFTSTNFGDLFLESFTSILDCIPDLVGKYVGAALNADGSAVKSYVNGNRKSLPYPFSCAEILIDITNSLMNQALVNYVTESPNNLVLPNIPKFRG
ncbi:unnamed protein product [Chironomus riparius]|uniref:Uncharacterized protein n=1 Tax=Chironomus riparius TaxID=315576 RepID=A0A9N9RHM4_9DIPT|nr:unnamed protein product [Chironomus riparius]